MGKKTVETSESPLQHIDNDDRSNWKKLEHIWYCACEIKQFFRWCKLLGFTQENQIGEDAEVIHSIDENFLDDLLNEAVQFCQETQYFDLLRDAENYYPFLAKRWTKQVILKCLENGFSTLEDYNSFFQNYSRFGFPRHQVYLTLKALTRFIEFGQPYKKQVQDYMDEYLVLRKEITGSNASDYMNQLGELNEKYYIGRELREPGLDLDTLLLNTFNTDFDEEKMKNDESPPQKNKNRL